MTVSRRDYLKATAAATLAGPAMPMVWLPRKRKLRVLGTHVTLQEPLRQQAARDLGIEIEFHPGGSAEVLFQAATKPQSFDLYEQWSNSMRVLWQANSLQPIETRKLDYWDEINDLTKTGRLTKNAREGAGDAPHKLLYVQDDDSLGQSETKQVSYLPYVHNVDSFGYNAAEVPRGQPYQTESWSWLLDRKWSGRVALVNAPTIGLFDAALAVEAAGLAKFENIGDLTHQEIDTLFGILVDLRRQGHFRGVWSSVPRSVELMKDGEVVIESMFSPGVSSLKGQGIDCVYAAPAEGYRAWHGVMCMSAACTGDDRDAAYAYMNWWLSGWPGAFIARQGYYISNPQRSRQILDRAEWDYWYEGKPAARDLIGTAGQVVVRQGESRNGGSYEKRFGNIAVWNTVMKSYEYSLSAWNEFLSAN